MKINVLKHCGISGLVTLVGLIITGCDSQIYDDLPPCQTDHYLKFRYDYNMKYADAFPSEVGAVAVWAFDSNGNLVWEHKESGEVLSSGDYRVVLPLAPGKYDFVSWCGLTSNSPFELDANTPRSISELGMTLTKYDEPLPGLYHSIRRGVEIADNPSKNEEIEI